jgi:HEPN domain-containing protein
LNAEKELPMTEAEQMWIDQAWYDFETARVMLDASRYLYVLFCCQQAVEKVLKAKITGLTGELPPRINNLSRLAKAAGLKLDKDHSRFLKKLSRFYVKTIFFPEREGVLKSNSMEDLAESTFKETGEIIAWLLAKQE